jgi:hypothetical protein
MKIFKSTTSESIEYGYKFLLKQNPNGNIGVDEATDSVVVAIEVVVDDVDPDPVVTGGGVEEDPK